MPASKNPFHSPSSAIAEKDTLPMGQFTRFIAWTGFAASLGLCVFDFITSVKGIWIMLGRRDEDPIAMFMPMIFATLALAFNGLSAYMFRMYTKANFTTFAPTVTCIMWVFFVAYDFISSFVGMLDTYATTPIDSWGGIVRAMRDLGATGGCMVMIMALLLSFGPFLCCMFYELARTETEPGL